MTYRTHGNITCEYYFFTFFKTASVSLMLAAFLWSFVPYIRESLIFGRVLYLCAYGILMWCYLNNIFNVGWVRDWHTCLGKLALKPRVISRYVTVRTYHKLSIDHHLAVFGHKFLKNVKKTPKFISPFMNSLETMEGNWTMNSDAE